MRGGNIKSCKYLCNRSGTAAIEAALVAPLLILIMLGAIDVGQYVNVAQSVSNASREGARVACGNETVEVSQVTAAVLNYLGEIFPNLSDDELVSATEITVRDESEGQVMTGDLTSIETGSQMSVRVDMDFSAVRWLNGIHYFDGQYKQTTTFTRRE